MNIHLYINGQLADLYADETISLTSKLKDYRDVTKSYGDFSQEFSIPASGINNIILNRFADGEIIDGSGYLDYRTKIPATIDVNGTQNIDGFITYNKCLYKDDVMDSHVVAFTSTLLNLTELFGEDLLRDLPLSQYDHLNTPINVSFGMNPLPLLFNGDIKYSLMTNNELDWTPERLAAGISSTEFRPSIRIPRIIDAINEKYSAILEGFNLEFTYNSNYYLLPYNELYLWCGNKLGEEQDGSAIGLEGDRTAMWFDTIDWQGQYVYVDPTTGIFGSEWTYQMTRIKFGWDVTPSTANIADPYSIEIYGINNSFDVGDLLFTVGNLTGVFADDLILDPNTGAFNAYNYYLMVLKSDTPDLEMTFDNYTILYDYEAPGGALFGLQNGIQGSKTNISTGVAINDMSLKLPKMKVIDFIKGFMTLNNAVLWPERIEGGLSARNKYYMEPYDSWRDLQHNKRYPLENLIEFDEETDIDSHTVTIPPIPKSVNVLYENPKAINNKLLKEFRGRGYGDMMITSLHGTGTDYNIELPFENMMYTSVNSGGTSGHTYLIGYAVSNEGTFQQDYKYTGANGVVTIDIVNGLSVIYDTAYLQLFDSTASPSCSILLTKPGESNLTANQYSVFNSYSYNGTGEFSANTLNYGAEVDYWTDTVKQTGLYDAVYKNYLELFLNPTTRIHNYKIRLTPVDLAYLYLYKTVQIGDKFFTINKYKYNSTSQIADFELIRYLRDNDKPLNISTATDYIRPEICSIGVIPNDVPTAPTGVFAYDITNTKVYQFTLGWTVSTSSDSVIDKYEIYRNGELYTTQEDGTRDTWDISGLPLEYTANWTIQAIDANGLRSEFSTPLEVTTANNPVPEFVEPITLDLATPHELTFSWLPATPGTEPIVYYEVYLNNILQGSRLATHDLTITIDNLNSNTQYDIFILAYEDSDACECGNFGESLTYQFSTILPTAFNDPIILDNATYNSLDISWTPATPGYPLDYYEIYLDGILYDTVDSVTNNYTFSNLDYSTSYNIYVKVVDIRRASDISATVIFDTLTPTGPIFNNPVSVNFTTLNSISISWLDATAGDFNIAHYDMYIDGILDGSVNAIDANTYTFTGLTDGVSYAIYVKAVDTENLSNDSDTINVLTSSTITTGLSAVYEMNDTGTVLVDSFGTSDGTILNATTSQPGKIGNSILLNGTTSYLTTNVTNDGVGGSISMWVKTTNAMHDYANFVSNNIVSPTETYVQGILGTILVDINGTGGDPLLGTIWARMAGVGGVGGVSDNSTVVTNQSWHLITITWEQGDYFKYYRDGVFINQSAMPTFTSQVQNQPFWIGKTEFEQDCPGNCQNSNLGAYVDQTCFWSRAITATEVSTLWNNGIGIAYPFS